MKVYLERTERGIRPATSDDADKVRRIPPGDVFAATYSKPRNAALFRKFHALCNAIAENHPDLDNVDAVKLRLKILAGHYDEYITKQGEVIYVPRSIAYDELEPADFEAFYEKCVAIAGRELGVDVTEFE